MKLVRIRLFPCIFAVTATLLIGFSPAQVLAKAEDESGWRPKHRNSKRKVTCVRSNILNYANPCKPKVAPVESNPNVRLLFEDPAPPIPRLRPEEKATIPIPVPRPMKPEEPIVVTAKLLNPTYNLRTEPNIKSRSRGLVGSSMGNGISIDSSAADPDWLKVSTADGDGWVNRQALSPMRVRGDFNIRTEPSLSAGKRVGLVSEALGSDNLVFTGRRRTTEKGDKSNTFMEVIYKGKQAWIHEKALLDEAPEEPKMTAASKPTREKPVAQPEKLEEKGHIVPVAAPKSRSPRCVSSKAALDKNEELKKALKGTNPFTTWEGIWGAKVIVKPDGKGILKHPIKGEIPFRGAICMDSKKNPYISIYGIEAYQQNIPLQGPDLAIAVVTDGGNSYRFRRASK